MKWGMLFQAGHVGTSALYVYPTIFRNGIKDTNDILGALSLIYYTLTLLSLIKYVLFVSRAHDIHKDGKKLEDEVELPRNQLGLSQKPLRGLLENNIVSKYVVFVATMLSTCLIIGDAVLTPSISVLSAMGGLKAASSSVFTQERIVWITVAVLVLLFTVQRFGADKVKHSFAPTVSVWFMMNAGIGLYNLMKYDPTVIKAFNPRHIISYFIRNGEEAWISLGGVVLCVAGTQLLFANVGNFSVNSRKISTSVVICSSLMLIYSGQASYLRLHQYDVANAFYASIPGSLYWPMFLISVLAAIVTSQATVSATLSSIQHSLSLALESFSHLTIVPKERAYAPKVTHFIMMGSVIVTLALRTTENIGNAYGIVVIFAEIISSSFMLLVMLILWKTNIKKVFVYVCACSIMSVELVYVTWVLYRFPQGGYFFIAFASISLFILILWNFIRQKKNYFNETESKVSPKGVRNIPGLAIFYSDLVLGVPVVYDR